MDTSAIWPHPQQRHSKNPQGSFELYRKPRLPKLGAILHRRIDQVLDMHSLRLQKGEAQRAVPKAAGNECRIESLTGVFEDESADSLNHLETGAMHMS